jgi:hypothetical protein
LLHYSRFVDFIDDRLDALPGKPRRRLKVRPSVQVGRLFGCARFVCPEPVCGSHCWSRRIAASAVAPRRRHQRQQPSRARKGRLRSSVRQTGIGRTLVTQARFVIENDPPAAAVEAAPPDCLVPTKPRASGCRR